MRGFEATEMVFQAWRLTVFEPSAAGSSSRPVQDQTSVMGSSGVTALGEAATKTTGRTRETATGTGTGKAMPTRGEVLDPHSPGGIVSDAVIAAELALLDSVSSPPDPKRRSELLERRKLLTLETQLSLEQFGEVAAMQRYAVVVTRAKDRCRALASTLVQQNRKKDAARVLRRAQIMEEEAKAIIAYVTK